ncbi:MAG: ABC transporter ATP-binding protein [Paludibacteraceae bacterium]|nr:ABC transporter ATP-binding protein [Paludibacteraceae bacterium]
MNILKLLHRFIPPYRGKVVLNILFNILSTVLSLFSFATIIPMLRLLFGISTANSRYIELVATMSIKEYIEAARGNMYWWIGQMVSDYGAGTVLMMLGVFLVVTTGLKCLCAWLANFFIVPIRTGVLRDLRQQLYNKVTRLPIGYFTEERKGDIMSRMTNDVNEVEASIMSTVDILFKNPLMILIYLIMLFIISWQLTLFAMILLPVAGLLIGRIGRSLKRSSTIGQEQTADILTQIEETLGGLRVVKAFNAEEKLQARFLRLINDTRRTFTRINRRYYLAHPVSEFLGTALIAVLLWYGGGLILSHNSLIDASTFIYYLILFYSIINPAKDLSKASYGIRRGTAALDRIDKILNTANPIQDPAHPVTIERPITTIEYRNVSFSYRADVPVLQDINLTIPQGAMVALVGQSGSGKTTLADLLPRFYDVKKGEVTINGVDVRQTRVRDLRSLMGIVNQEAILFNDTFFNNITFGVDTSQPAPNGQTWEQAVENAARIANAHDFIMETPDGYQTTVGDRGSKLSGGQRQRISIARAILKNPPILILDEATSALDTKSEKIVQDALERLMKDRTTIVVAHRLSTIRNADIICVIHDGRIVEQGKHDELLALNGYYAKLYAMQS